MHGATVKKRLFVFSAVLKEMNPSKRTAFEMTPVFYYLPLKFIKLRQHFRKHFHKRLLELVFNQEIKKNTTLDVESKNVRFCFFYFFNEPTNAQLIYNLLYCYLLACNITQDNGACLINIQFIIVLLISM
jgi:hypothetical protein